jgi:hypothetical protein
VAVVVEIGELLLVQRAQPVALPEQVPRLVQVMDAVAEMAEVEMVAAMALEQARDKFPAELLQLLPPVPQPAEMAEAEMLAAMDVVVMDVAVTRELQAHLHWPQLPTMQVEMMPPDQWQATRAPVVVDSRL